MVFILRLQIPTSPSLVMDTKISENLNFQKTSKVFEDSQHRDQPEGENCHHEFESEKIGTDYNFKREIVLKNAVGFLFLHIVAIYGLYLMLSFKIKLATWPWVLVLLVASGEGITMGAHRLFSHKTFKATFSLRLLLIILQTVAGQNCMYIWVRDHRQHHKFSDTDADPHNAHRGFFFSHVGWLMSRKHPLVKEKGKTIDMTDMEADELVMFQKKHYKLLYLFLAVVIPVSVPLLWGETLWNAVFTCYFFRYVMVLNQTWSVNSAAHLFGTKPFDKYILPAENNFVAFISAGEGWHNYHHVFPWDYKTSEYGAKYNLTTSFIHFFQSLGLAYDLKTAPYKMIEQRTLRTGDGNYSLYGAKKDKTFRWGEENHQSLDQRNGDSTKMD